MAKKSKDLDFNIEYDEFADILYISFGKPRPGIAIEKTDGDFIRIDPYTDEVVGITIIDFKSRYMKSSSIGISETVEKLIPNILEKLH